MTCRVRNTRENLRFSYLEKVSEDFFHGQLGIRSRPCICCAIRRVPRLGVVRERSRVRLPNMHRARA